MSYNPPGGVNGMERLRQRDFRALGEFLRGSYASLSRDAFVAHALRALGPLVPADVTTYNVVHPKRGMLRIDREPAGGPELQALHGVLSQYIRQHPMIERYVQTGEGEAYQFSDFMSQRQLHGLALYNEYYRVFGTEFQMTVRLSSAAPLLVGFALSRRGPKFSERERLMLNVLQSHLTQAHHHAGVMERMQARLAMLGRAVEAADAGLVLLTADGRIELMTRRARRWLEAYFGRPGRRIYRLPDDVRRWVRQQTEGLAQTTEIPPPRMPLVVTRAGRRLELWLVSDGEQPALVLEERREGPDSAGLASLGLTLRETEVLVWVAQGKRNEEIGTILGARPRTIAKHVERIHAKLGVDTRAAATARAFAAWSASENKGD